MNSAGPSRRPTGQSRTAQGGLCLDFSPFERLLISTFVSGTSAPAIVNLIYFPMIYLSGLFPFGMPKALQVAAAIWPAFNLNQLALSG